MKASVSHGFQYIMLLEMVSKFTEKMSRKSLNGISTDAINQNEPNYKYKSRFIGSSSWAGSLISQEEVREVLLLKGKRRE